MRPIWNSYLSQMKTLRQQASESKLLLELSPEHIAGGGSSLGCSQEDWAQNMLDRAAATEFLAQCPQSVMAAYGFLMVQISAEFNAVQNSKLLLTCMPFMPDYIQLCNAILDGPDGQGPSSIVKGPPSKWR